MLEFFRFYKNRKHVSIPYNKVWSIDKVKSGTYAIITKQYARYDINEESLLCGVGLIPRLEHFHECLNREFTERKSSFLRVNGQDITDMKSIDHTCRYSSKINIHLDCGVVLTIDKIESTIRSLHPDRNLLSNIDNEFRRYNGDC